tara:strand:- start:465 stop:638 length:174 start_codon:yes stop_codon:yes gene_type:complete
MFDSKYISFKNIYFIFFYNVANLQHKKPLNIAVFDKKIKKICLFNQGFYHLLKIFFI